MPEPFKTLFSPALVVTMAGHLADRDPGFDAAGFVAMAADGLEALELKARAARITRALDAHLPADFDAACELMLATLHPEDEPPPSIGGSDAAGLRGWAIMPMADLVALRGARRLDRSLDVLAEMTKRFSAEFAVRPFLAAEPERALRRFMAWTADPNLHVRRLASEGSRPRLPWGIRLNGFVADPAPLLPLLARLRDDPSDYVRRSVANSLNDIAKDHPDLVAEVARDWLRDAPPARARLVRHAARTLIKRGHRPTLSALGFGDPRVRAELALETPRVRFGEALRFVVSLAADGGGPERLVVDYRIDFPRANGGVSGKVFKLRTLELLPGRPVRLAKAHPFRPITTRTHRNGRHALEILVNGTAVARAGFELGGVG